MRNKCHFTVQGHSRPPIFGTNRKLTYNFLSVINTNSPAILHRLRDLAFEMLKIAIFGYPLVFKPPYGGVPLGRSP